MITVTATIIIGTPHLFHGGIIPTHIIFLSENDRPALILRSLKDEEERIVIPTIENTVNDIFLIIAVYLLKALKPSREISNDKRDSLL